MPRRRKAEARPAVPAHLVDTNVILRFLIGDDSPKAARATALMERDTLEKAPPGPAEIVLALTEDFSVTTHATATKREEHVGRFSVEFEVVNHQDVVAAQLGVIPPDRIRRTRLSAVVDTGSTRLVLPDSTVAALGLPQTGQITVRFADGRQDRKAVVGDVQVEILNRSSVFTAVVEAGRTDALIGAIVLEELDLLPDCTARALVPRDPRGLFAEID